MKTLHGKTSTLLLSQILDIDLNIHHLVQCILRQANKVTNALARQGLQLALCNQTSIFPTPPTFVRKKVKVDQEEVVATKYLYLLVSCNKLVCFDNLFVLNAQHSEHALNRAPQMYSFFDVTS